MRCVFCKEDWFLDSVHETVSDIYHDEYIELREKYKNDTVRHEFQNEYETRFFNVVLNDFYKRGCVALGGYDCRKKNGKRDELLTEMINVLGDDVDAMESFLEDYADLI